MRYLLRILALAALCGAAHATVFTAVQSGDWQANTTWGTAAGAVCHVNFPCMTDGGSGGDQAVIPSTFTVTCGLSVQETCSAGTSPADNVTLAISVTAASGGLSVAHQSTLIYAGTVTVADGNTFQVGAGCTLQQDSSWAATPANPAATGSGYAWKMGSSTLGATFALQGTTGSHITWQGDASFSSGVKVAGTPCPAGTCLGGGIDYVSGALFGQVGWGSMTWVDFKNIKGNTNGSTTIAFLANAGSTSNLGGITYSNITFTHSGTMRITVSTDTDINTIAISGISFTDCISTSSADGCMRFGSVSTANTGLGTYTITGMTADGDVGTAGASTAGAIKLRNVFMWAGLLGGFPHIGVGFPNDTDGGLKDQIFVDDNAWNTGGAQTAVNVWLGPNTTSSTYWADRIAPSGIHMSFTRADWSSLGTGQNSQVLNNVFGALGAADSQGHFGNTSGTTPTGAETYTYTGNVEIAGYNGQCSTPMPGSYINLAATANITATVRGNTFCNITNAGGLQPSGGAGGVESVVVASGTVASIDSNLFYCVLSAGCNMAAFQGANNTNASTTAITYLGGNAAVNVLSTYQQQFNFAQTLSAVGNASAGSTVYTGTFANGGSNAFLNMKATITGFVNGVNNGTFVISASTTTTITVNNASGSAESHAASAQLALNFIATLGTDQTFTTASHGAPRMVDPIRSVPFFDTDYLSPAGLLLTSSYGASAWVTSHAYSVGDTVSFSDATAFGGKTSYWRCTVAHTSGATNKPILGVDGSNPYQGPPGFWEEAYLQWFRLRVLDNSTYNDQCAGLLFVSCPATTYITGLLNAWLRQGYVSIDPSLWNGCVAGNGGAVVECGALPLKAVQHIPPPASVL